VTWWVVGLVIVVGAIFLLRDVIRLWLEDDAWKDTGCNEWWYSE
jgi:hypothetical protein